MKLLMMLFTIWLNYLDDSSREVISSQMVLGDRHRCQLDWNELRECTCAQTQLIYCQDP